MSANGSENKQKDRRRFTRVLLEPRLDVTRRVLGASAQWSNGDMSSVLDVSYTGIALERPPGLDHKAGDVVSLNLQLGEEGKFSVEVEVMWTKDRLLGLNFSRLDGPAQMILDRFLSDKLVGAHLHLVSKKFYGPSLDCDYWFQGPRDTNILVWFENSHEKVARAQIEFEGQVLVFSDGEIRVGGGQEQGEIQQTYREDEVHSEGSEAPPDLSHLVKRVVAVMSQVPDRPEAIKKFLRVLLEGV